MKQPHNETAALIRAAADATGCRTVSAFAQRINVPLRTRPIRRRWKVAPPFRHRRAPNSHGRPDRLSRRRMAQARKTRPDVGALQTRVKHSRSRK